MTSDLTPVETRAQDADFVAECSMTGLKDRLPLTWPVPADVPPSPKHAYRSHYVYPGWEALEDAEAWDYLSDFEIVLYLVDFAPLRPVLAQRLGWTSAKGQKPFDPISLFLLLGWQITNSWNRAETLRQLRHPRNADLARCFGFEDDDFPTEGGVRYWLTTIGENAISDETVLLGDEDAEEPIEVAVQLLNQIIAQSVMLLVENGFLSREAWKEAFVCPDGMLHHAASRKRCSAVDETCYQPTSPDDSRPCPAQEKDRQGCDCDTIACAEVCQYATPWDAEARFIWYTGSNQPQHSPNRSTDDDQEGSKRGKGVYGYRSLPLQIPDPNRRFSIILVDDFLPANAREENPAAALLAQLSHLYPSLEVDAVAGDAGFGYDIFLSVTYNVLEARRVVDQRSHPTDDDKSLWPMRGYDDKGRPVCPYGYSFTANGFDADRQRHKWFCGQACLDDKEPLVFVEDVPYPPMECPHTDPEAQPFGKIINVEDHFDDGSIRLVRDIPVDTPAWKRIYHRARNAVEGRNAAFEKWGLKRLPIYGAPRGRATIFLADVWLNLTTLARLVREATAATGNT
jgi:hypothetical protein